MEDGTILGWINANGAVVGAVSAAIGFVFGFRSNLWLHRRQEWNAAVDRARAVLLRHREYANAPFQLAPADVDFFLAQAPVFKRRRIATALARNAQIGAQYQQDAYGQAVYTPAQQAEIAALRERLLSLLARR